MTKIKYKRKTNPANLTSNSKYKYAFFMTPKSLAKQKRFINNQSRTQNYFFDIPLSEIKYNRCVQFEAIITTIISNLLIETTPNIWNWDKFYNRSKQEFRENWKFYLDKTDSRNQFYYENNYEYHDKHNYFEFLDVNSDNLYHVRLPRIIGNRMCMMGVNGNGEIIQSTLTQTMAINDIGKYYNEPLDDITKYLFNGLRVLLNINGKNFNLVMQYLEIFESFLDFNREIYEEAIQSINDNDYTKFSRNFGLLVNNDYVTKFSDLNDNINVDLPSDSVVTNTHCIYKFFEALNATKHDVLLTPNKKNYYKVSLPNVGNKTIIDTFNVYFETKDDVERFSQVYKHYSSYSEIVLCQTTVDDCQTNSGFLNIHEYDYQHTKIFQEKLSKSSIPVHISTRKTPYKGVDIHGYIHLGTIITEQNLDVFNDETLLEYLNGIEARLRKLGMSEDLVYNRNTYYSFSSQPFGGNAVKNLTSKIMVIHEKHEMGGIDFVPYNEMKKRYSKWYIANTPSTFFNSVNKVHVAIPIRCVGERIDGILALIRRQKLVNDLGGFRIQTITIAPYAPHDSNVTEDIVDAISEL